MDAVTVLRSGLSDAHWFLEQTMEGLKPEHLHWEPSGTANTIAATYAHVVRSEDNFVQTTLRRRPTLAESDWLERTGLSIPIPERGSDWFRWSRSVRLDLAAAQAYAAAVYAASDAYLSSLRPEELAEAPDVLIPGNQTLAWLVNNMLVLHAATHTGEIAVLKGLQGVRGYL